MWPMRFHNFSLFHGFIEQNWTKMSGLLLEENYVYQWRIQDLPGAPTHYLAKICRKLHRNEKNWIGRARQKFSYVDPPMRAEYRFDDRTDLEKQFLSGRFVLVSRRLHALVHRLLQFVLDHSDVLVCALTSSLSMTKLKTKLMNNYCVVTNFFQWK